MHVRYLSPGRQSDSDLRALRLGAADLEAPSVQLHERLGDRQSQACALAPACAAAVDLAERSERHGNLIGGHAQSGVAHPYRGAAAGAGERLDDGRAARGCELDGVADEVAE